MSLFQISGDFVLQFSCGDLPRVSWIDSVYQRHFELD